MKKTLKILFAISTCFIFFASLLLLTQYSRASESNKEKSKSSEQSENNLDYITPDLVNKVYNDVKDDNIIAVREEYNKDFEEGHIISQSVNPGIRRSKKDIIEVVVSKGSNLKEVVDVIGLPGFSPVVKLVECNAPEGTVLGYSNGYNLGDLVRIDEPISIDVAC